MCNKLPYCNPRIDKCMHEIVEKINKEGIYRTLASCCGHEKYPKTIVVKERETGDILEYYTKIRLQVKKRNRYYKRDNYGFYFIPKLKGLECEMISIRSKGRCCPEFECLYERWDKKRCSECGADCFKCEGRTSMIENWNTVNELQKGE